MSNMFLGMVKRDFWVVLVPKRNEKSPTLLFTEPEVFISSLKIRQNSCKKIKEMKVYGSKAL